MDLLHWLINEATWLECQDEAKRMKTHDCVEPEEDTWN